MRDVSARGLARLHTWQIALRTSCDGATAAEYALLISLIAVAIVAAVAIFGGQLRGFFMSTSSHFQTATN